MSKIEFSPVDKSKWNDLEKLFGTRGACGGCWCMTWRLSPKEFKENSGEGNKKLLKNLVYQNHKPGILAYVDNEPAGWCAVAPREIYIRLENSKVLSRIDGEKVWSISCLFIAKKFRQQGLSTELIKNALKFCKQQGAKIVEAYPVEPYADNIPAAFAWTGIPSSFIGAGFKEVARRSRTRPIMRYLIK
jgi:GNAT superfamily N-acetyltransferase